MFNMDQILDYHSGEAANYKLDRLLELFPEGNFKFLRDKSIEYALNDEDFESFVNEALTGSIVPCHLQENDHENELDTSVFNVEKFLVRFPDPFSFFNSLQRNELYKSQMLEVLKDRFRNVSTHDIEDSLILSEYNLLKAAAYIADTEPQLVVMRQQDEINLQLPLEPNLRDEVLLLDHLDEVKMYMNILEEMKISAIAEGQVFECECCYSTDILLQDAIMCTEAHLFCRDCVKTQAQITIGNGLVEFQCLYDCPKGGIIPVESLETLLDGKMYEKLLARIAELEVQKANIPGTEYCQRCEYAVVLDDSIRVFKCVKCHFEMCRLCKKQTHVPRKCGETEQEDQQKQQRKHNEELQTARVVRRCGGCNKKYVKIDGCDKVTCSCGTTNCYRCGASGVDYSHTDRCQLIYPPV